MSEHAARMQAIGDACIRLLELVRQCHLAAVLWQWPEREEWAEAERRFQEVWGQSRPDPSENDNRRVKVFEQARRLVEDRLFSETVAAVGRAVGDVGRLIDAAAFCPHELVGRARECRGDALTVEVPGWDGESRRHPSHFEGLLFEVGQLPRYLDRTAAADLSPLFVSDDLVSEVRGEVTAAVMFATKHPELVLLRHSRELVDGEVTHRMLADVAKCRRSLGAPNQKTITHALSKTAPSGTRGRTKIYSYLTIRPALVNSASPLVASVEWPKDFDELQSLLSRVSCQDTISRDPATRAKTQ